MSDNITNNITLTGRVIDGNHLGDPRVSWKPYDTPTNERGIVELDGKIYERTVFERRIWRNMRPHKLVARFVIIDGTNYEIE